MIRRIIPGLLIATILILSWVLLAPFQVFALTPTLSPTRTNTVLPPTLTRTPSLCALPTAVSMTVSPVVSPTSATTQVVNVQVSAASVTITSEAGSFTSSTPGANSVFAITVNLVPNSANHLKAVATVTSACRPYTLSRSVDLNGNPLTIDQGVNLPTYTPTVTRTPTLTPTKTGTCLIPTPIQMSVSPVISPVNAFTQVVYVQVASSSVTITSESGSVTNYEHDANNVFAVTVSLVPNSVNHLTVTSYINVCHPYQLTRTVDSNGNPLTIVEGNGGVTTTPTVSPTPTGPLPDLTVLSITEYGISISTATPNAQGCWWVPGPTSYTATRVTIQNIGAADAGSFVLSMNGDQKTISGLAAGQTLTVDVGSTGSRTRTATVDVTGLVAESNENNNIFTQTLSAATSTATGTARPTQCRTPTPGGPTLTPTKTSTITPTPTTTSGVCSPVTATITAPFTWDGVGTYCWQSSNLGTYINNWNNLSVTINGINITNVYMGAGSYPAKIGGFWYISYSSNVAWAHFEAK